MNEMASTGLAPATVMGAVTLDVADLDGMTRFYRDVITLQVLCTLGERLRLSAAPERPTLAPYVPLSVACACARRQKVGHARPPGCWGQVVSRTTSSVGMISARSAGAVPASTWISSDAIVSPICSSGWRIVVSCGSRSVATGESS